MSRHETFETWRWRVMCVCARGLGGRWRLKGAYIHGFSGAAAARGLESVTVNVYSSCRCRVEALEPADLAR